MSVLIKGMDEMPEDGAVLLVRHDDNGKTYIKFACTYGYSMELVKLPEPHGRLIDADEITAFLELERNDINVESLDEFPTVIEAEGE